MIHGLGYASESIDELARLPAVLRTDGASAVIVGNRALGLKDLLAIQQSRSAWPAVPIVIVTTDGASQTDLKQALDRGATAFVSWPCAPETLQRVLVKNKPSSA